MAVLRRDKCITLRTDDLWLVVWRTTLQPHQPLAHVGTGASVVSVRWVSLSISTLLHLGTPAMAELCSGQGQPQSEDNLIPRPVSPVTLVSVPMKQRDYPLLTVSDSLFTHLPIIFTSHIIIIWWSFLRLLFLVTGCRMSDIIVIIPGNKGPVSWPGPARAPEPGGGK